MTPDQTKTEAASLAFAALSIAFLVSVIVRPIMIGFWLGWNHHDSTSTTAHFVIAALTLSVGLSAGLQTSSALKTWDTRRRATTSR